MVINIKINDEAIQEHTRKLEARPGRAGQCIELSPDDLVLALLDGGMQSGKPSGALIIDLGSEGWVLLQLSALMIQAMGAAAAGRIAAHVGACKCDPSITAPSCQACGGDIQPGKAVAVVDMAELEAKILAAMGVKKVQP